MCVKGSASSTMQEYPHQYVFYIVHSCMRSRSTLLKDPVSRDGIFIHTQTIVYTWVRVRLAIPKVERERQRKPLYAHKLKYFSPFIKLKWNSLPQPFCIIIHKLILMRYTLPLSAPRTHLHTLLAPLWVSKVSLEPLGNDPVPQPNLSVGYAMCCPNRVKYSWHTVCKCHGSMMKRQTDKVRNKERGETKANMSAERTVILHGK